MAFGERTLQLSEVLPTPLAIGWNKLVSGVGDTRARLFPKVVEWSMQFLALVELARLLAHLTEARRPLPANVVEQLARVKGADAFTGAQWFYLWKQIRAAQAALAVEQLASPSFAELHALIDRRNDATHRNHELTDKDLSALREALSRMAAFTEGRIVWFDGDGTRNDARTSSRVRICSGEQTSGHHETLCWTSAQILDRGLYWMHFRDGRTTSLVSLAGLISCESLPASILRWHVATHIRVGTEASEDTPPVHDTLVRRMGAWDVAEQRMDSLPGEDRVIAPPPASTPEIVDVAPHSLLRARIAASDVKDNPTVVPQTSAAGQRVLSDDESVRNPPIRTPRGTRVAFVAGIAFALVATVLLGVASFRRPSDRELAQQFLPHFAQEWEFRTSVCARNAQGVIVPSIHGAFYALQWDPSATTPLQIWRQRDDNEPRFDSSPRFLAVGDDHALLRAALCRSESCDDPSIIIYLFLHRTRQSQLRGFYVTNKGPTRVLWGGVSDDDSDCSTLSRLPEPLDCMLDHLLDGPMASMQRGLEHDPRVRSDLMNAWRICTR